MILGGPNPALTNCVTSGRGIARFINGETRHRANAIHCSISEYKTLLLSGIES